MPIPKLKLPKIKKVLLRRFSLFTANPNAQFDCNNGVLCLVGANGIGKSTLLSAINFCLTGIVADPNRPFESMEEYYKYTRDYSASYFRGRIMGEDEDDAEIAICFTLGTREYDLRRGMFEPDELRELTISDENSKEKIETKELSRAERHRAYVSNFIKHSGVSSFEEFSFLQLFVFTFDEQRKTLFWNSRIMDRVLYRAFGMEPDMAKKADSMWREIEQQDSRVRNFQWEATKMRKRINELRAKNQNSSTAKETYETLTTNHKELSEQFDEESKILHQIEDSLKDANLKLAEQAVHETSLRDEYARYFESRFKLRLPLAQHPWIIQSFKDKKCGLCGNDSNAALTKIASKIKEETCPICESLVKKTTTNDSEAKKLQEIDKELLAAKNGIKGTLKTLERLRGEHEKANSRWQKIKSKLDEFDQQNTKILEQLRQTLNQGSGEATLQDYREQLAAIENDKKKAYDLREELKTERAKLQKNLEQQYLQVEKNFVPRFAELAHKFLGMPLSVQMNSSAGRDVKLVVEVRGTPRRQQQNLSESQKFFLDIALRMALTQHMSDEGSKGSMFIDTPEGSLDIAYEKRAGDMLAMFAEAGHNIIMTANLNSSQLLLELANRCGRKKLQLCRMTDWAELSEVQQDEDELFDKAYNDIQNAMKE